MRLFKKSLICAVLFKKTNMFKKLSLLFIAASLTACGTFQSVVKSAFPYTAKLVVPLTAEPGKTSEVTSMSQSFDQKFSKDGNNAYKIKAVHVSSARIQADIPSDFNVGNIASIKVYLSKEDGSNEVLVAQRTDIGPNVGRYLTLDTDQSAVLDKLVRLPRVKVRMQYTLRNKLSVDATLHLALNLTAQAE